MAISYVFGTVGSGKTYDMICRVLDDAALGAQIVTINCRLVLPNIKRKLQEMGVSSFDADQTCGMHRVITTEDEFRRLRGTARRPVKLYADEAHFWWPANAYYKLNINDVYKVAMSRKSFVDLHMISQRYGQIHKDISGYSSDVWHAMRATSMGFPKMLKQWNRWQQLRGSEVTPVAFHYLKKEGDQGRENFNIDTAPPTLKRLRLLKPSIAQCYDTTEEVSSPVLDRIRREEEINYFRDVLFGRVKPSEPCAVCDGSRRVQMVQIWNEVTGEVETVPHVAGSPLHSYFLRFAGAAPCEACGAQGYVYPVDHPDFEIAEKYRFMFDKSGRRKTNQLADVN